MLVHPGWSAALLVPVVLLRGRGRGGGRSKGASAEGKKGWNGAGESAFVCERVCTSDKLLRTLGNLVKDPTPDACVTVCGESTGDACTEACQRAVCVNAYQVPSWNDQCLKSCTLECQRVSARRA